ncbi:MAG: type II secretion system F family protein [Acidobacteria bacterium]|nr:MAG: type II secretion system F family protein [Acidobacteriota bacterium]
MPVYRYRGRRSDSGAAVVGERSATNKQALATLLRNERILPVSIVEKGDDTPAAAPRSRGRVSSKTLALFTRQFSVMIDSGLPLTQCLAIMADQQENRHFRTVLEKVREDVESGSTLAEAMKKHPSAFDNLFTNMISAGEIGGILDVILRRLSIFVEKAAKLKRAVVSASVYPVVIMLVAVIVVFVIMIWVIPVFATVFTGMNVTLPLPTRVIMAISSFMTQFILPIIALVVLGVLGFRYYYKTESGRFVIDRTLLQVPIIGLVLKKIAIARFSRTLATLLVSGVSILEALDIVAGTAGNVVLQSGLMKVRKDVEEGKTLVEPLKKVGIFPPMVTQMVAVGEQTGELDQMLEKLADYYEEEADQAIANMMTLFEPVMIVFLGVVIGGIVISLYLPIFSLINKLSTR